MNYKNAQKPENDVSLEGDQQAEAFLDLWQDNIRCWSEERDLFTLQSLLEAVRRGSEKKGPGDGA
ncbi:MAG: hypothetical protein AB3N28_09700 [Kordiimonas sp.]